MEKKMANFITAATWFFVDDTRRAMKWYCQVRELEKTDFQLSPHRILLQCTCAPDFNVQLIYCRNRE